MSRDMKPRKRSSAARRKSGGGTLFGLFIGLVIGVLAAACVVWYIHKTPPPFANRGVSSPSSPTAPPTPLALPGKPGDPIPQDGDKPRFDFYKILPESGSPAPGANVAGTKPEGSKPAEEVVSRDPLYLQTGSFQNAGDADNQKASLAMMGVEASIQQVMLQDKVWYRVRLGPFKRIEDVNAVRSEMAKQGIDANIVKKD